MRKILMLTLVAVVWAAALSVAQPPEKFTNLKILDSTIAKQQLIGIMRSFSGGLGVHCDYCHAQTKGPNGEEQDDFASDSNSMKKVAREMMKMVQFINGEALPKAVGDTAHMTRVECVTCHRGQPVPKLIQDVLMEAYTDGGADSVLSTYNTLHEKYYGRHTFDFADYVLSGVGSDIAAKDNAGALKILEFNTKQYPNSAGVWFSLARVYADSGDKAKAKEALQTCLKVNPEFRPATQMLKMLDGGQKP